MRVLLVTHEASRSGAPRIAILVARSLVQQGYALQILSRAPGPLLPEFEAASATSIEFLHRVRRKLWRTWGIRGLAYLVDTLLAAVTLIRRWPDLVYVNSASAAIYLRPARWLGRRVVLHVHESGALAAELPEDCAGSSSAERDHSRRLLPQRSHGVTHAHRPGC